MEKKSRKNTKKEEVKTLTTKKSIIIGLVSLFIVTLLLLGLTYAYYRTRVIGNQGGNIY